jgi:hypothetical protein
MNDTVSVPIDLLDIVVIASLRLHLDNIAGRIKEYADLMAKETEPNKRGYFQERIIEELRDQVCLREALAYYGG